MELDSSLKRKRDFKGLGLSLGNSMKSDISSGMKLLTDSALRKIQKRKGPTKLVTSTYRYPHQRRSFIHQQSSRDGLISTARPTITQTVPSKSTANVTYQASRLPQTVKKSAMINPKQTWRPKGNYLDSVNRDNGSYTLKQFEYAIQKEDLKDYAIIDSGCSGSMTGDKDKLSDFKEFKGGYVAFGNDSKGGRISGKGTIKTSCLDFEKVSYVEELKFNLLSVSQICDKKHNVLFTDKECLILSPKFKFVEKIYGNYFRANRMNAVFSLD
ncbi:hypothetical protein Tco_1281774 [Tanacetum coccineum]